MARMSQKASPVNKRGFGKIHRILDQRAQEEITRALFYVIHDREQIA